jgi:hypothetical protein
MWLLTVGSKKVPISQPPEQLEKIRWQIWKALEILPARDHVGLDSNVV